MRFVIFALSAAFVAWPKLFPDEPTDVTEWRSPRAAYWMRPSASSFPTTFERRPGASDARQGLRARVIVPVPLLRGVGAAYEVTGTALPMAPAGQS